jgi:hypothetical protein
MSKIDWSIGTRLTKKKKRAIVDAVATFGHDPEVVAFLKDKWKL